MDEPVIEERLIRSPSGLSARLEIVATEQGTRYRVAFIGKDETDPSLFSIEDLHDLAHFVDTVYRAAEDWQDEQHHSRSAPAG